MTPRPSILAATAAVAVLLAATARGGGGQGRIVFATGGDGGSKRLEVASVRPDGTGFRKLTHEDPVADWARWTPDGRIVFGTSDDSTEGSALWTVAGDGTQLERLPGEEFDPVSPSGRYVLLFTAAGVRIVTAHGRPVRTLHVGLRRDDFYEDALWSRDERYIAFTVDTETDTEEYSRIVVVRSDGRGGAHALTPRGGTTVAFAYAWIGDDRLLAEIDDGLVTMSAGGRDRRPVRRPPARRDWDVTRGGTRMAWVGVGGAIYAAPSDHGPARLVMRTLWRDAASRAVAVWWSPDGRSLAVHDSGGTWIVRADGRGRRLLTTRSGPVAWSDDSARILLTDADGIWILGARDGRATRVTTSLQDDDAVVSPDGSHVAFLRGSPGLDDPARIAVYVVGSDGRGRVRLGRGYGSRWSPDGRSVAFVEPPLERTSGGRLATGKIWVAARDGSTRRVVGLGTAPDWSPDGSSLAFMRYTLARNEDGVLVAAEGTLLVARADGSASHVLAHWEAGLTRPRWSPDGTTILVEDSTLEAFDLVDAATGESREVRHFGSEYAWSPGGDLLAFATYGQVGVVRPDGGGERILAHALSNVRGPVWSPDGSRLAFVVCSDKCDIFSVSADGTGWRRVTHTPGVDGLPSWSR